MNPIRLTLLCLFLIIQCRQAWALPGDEILATRCVGGDSPKPTADISNIFPPGMGLVHSDGNVQEFLVTEDRNQVLYRNDRNQIFASSLDGRFQTPISISSKPLSRLLDPDERFLLTERDSWVLDLWSRPAWFHFQPPGQPVQHLFWNAQRLYDLVADGSTKHFYRYQAGNSSASRICPSVGIGGPRGYRIGEGHQFPWVFLYEVDKLSGGNRLALYKLNVNNCKLFELKRYGDLIEGNVQNVIWFEAQQSYLIKIDSPTKQLMWDTKDDDEHCHSYNIGKSSFLALNHRKPVIATFEENHGVTLLYLHGLNNEPPRSAKILQNVPIKRVRPSDVWLTKDGGTLYVAPEFNDGSRRILKISLPE